MSIFERTELLIGKSGIEKLNNSHVAVFGCGGVGGYVCEMLARAGVGTLTIVDFDVVSESNINRQIIALHSTVGKPKVEVLKNRLLDINPNLIVNCYPTKYDESTKNTLLNQKYDYVVDAIDMVKNKIDLIETCHKLNLKIVSAMGAGNRFDVPNFEVCNIFKTYNDGLAKVLRKQLKNTEIKEHNVVFSKSQATPNGRVVGSISYYPPMCGCVIAGFVINELLNKKN